MPTPEHLFRDFLRQRKLKYTSERLAILEAVQKFRRPFEAEELLLELRESAVRASKATLYRTLKHLLDAGLLKQVHFGVSKQAHYDFVNPAEGPGAGGGGAPGGGYDHLLDIDTRKIIPFSSDSLVKIREEIARNMGFTALSHRFQIIARKKTD